MPFSTVIGVAGMLLIIYGAVLPAILLQKILFLIGGIMLLATAIMERQKYLIGMEIIVFIGTVIAFFSITTTTKTLILLASCLFIIPWLIKEGEIGSKQSIVGLFGLLALALGYAVSTPWIYLAGGLLLCTYSLILVRDGVKIAYLWGVLNGFFSLTAFMQILRIYI